MLRALVVRLRNRRERAREKRRRSALIAREVAEHRRAGQNELSKYEGPPQP